MATGENEKSNSPTEVDFTAIRILADLDRISLAKIVPSFEQVHVKAGQILYRAGDPGDAFYIIVDGIVRVFVAPGGQAYEIACLGSGEWFGEMALLTNELRTNDIEAQTDLVLLKLSREDFDHLIKKYPSLGVSIAGLLASKLVATNAFIQQISSSKTTKATSDKAAVKDEQVIKQIPKLSATELRTQRRLKTRKIVSLILIIVMCGLSALALVGTTLNASQILLVEFLFAATILWCFQTFSFHSIALALPVAVVLFGISPAKVAFSGFPSATWFLVLAVFCLSASIAKTGLLYRLTLIMMKRFPKNYIGQTLAVAISGLLLTPIVPSPNGRLLLSSPLVLTLSEILGFKKGSSGAVGLSMANLLGYGNMSFMFMNGSFVCFFMIALLPQDIGLGITWFYWFRVAVVLSVAYFTFFYLSIIAIYHPKEIKTLVASVTDIQLKTLGPLSKDEKVCLLAIVLTLAGFLTQSWHHIDGAWIALASIIILFATSVLDDKTLRSSIDWAFLLSLGALIGFGNVISASGLTPVFAQAVKPYLEFFATSKLLFLIIVAIGVVVIRIVLPAFPALVVCMLALLPIGSALEINPFVIGLVVFLVNEPWFFPHQNMIFQTLMSSSEGRLFDHAQTVKLAFLHVVTAIIAVACSYPYWKYLGLIR